MKSDFSRSKKLLALLLAMLTVLTMTCTLMTNAYAATSVTGTITNSTHSAGMSQTKNISVKTGSGITYFFGKKTTFTIKNTGKYSISLYQYNSGLFSGTFIYKTEIPAGNSVSYSLSGNGKSYAFFVKCPGSLYNNKETFTVSVSAGSCSIS